MEFSLTRGEGRTRVSLQAINMGNDLVVRIFNENAHIGAVAIGEYDLNHQRASVSVLTRLGHKDDAIAYKAAYNISKSTHKPVCVITGVHISDISQNEIGQINQLAGLLIEEFSKVLMK